VAPEEEPVDEGLAPERTDLAWNRTGLAVVVCIAVLVRRLWPLKGTDQVVALACISAGATAWAVVLWMGRAVSQRTGSGRAATDPRLMSPHRAAAITVGTLALALAALALSLFPPT
jgi:uncharacterized membrane protein YidH (DUF202 family)